MYIDAQSFVQLILALSLDFKISSRAEVVSRGPLSGLTWNAIYHM